METGRNERGECGEMNEKQDISERKKTSILSKHVYRILVISLYFFTAGQTSLRNLSLPPWPCTGAVSVLTVSQQVVVGL